MSLFKRKRKRPTSISVCPENEQKRTFGAALAETLATTTKQIVWMYTLFSCGWITASYVLAFLGREQIAETLSSSVVTIVIGQLGFYLVTKTVENVFRYNDFGGKSSYPEDKSNNYKTDLECPVEVPEAPIPPVPMNGPDAPTTELNPEEVCE